MSPYDDNWNGEPPERARVVRRALGWRPMTLDEVKAALAEGRKERIAAERTMKRSPRR